MPLGEIAAEMMKPFVEIVLCGAAYWTGYICIKVLTFGTADIASFWTIDENGKKKRKHSKKGVLLKKDAKIGAQFTAILGFIIWVVIGVTIYYSTESEPQKDEVTTEVSEFQLCKISITGEVTNPKIWTQPYQTEHSLLNVLRAGGGATTFAKYLYVVREHESYFEIRRFAVRDIMANKNSTFKVRSNDAVDVRTGDSTFNHEQGLQKLSHALEQRILNSGKEYQLYYH